MSWSSSWTTSMPRKINMIRSLICWWPAHSGVTLGLDRGFLSKVMSPTFVKQYVDLAGFHDRKLVEYSLLNPVCTLRYCFDWNVVMRSSDQLFVGRGGSWMVHWSTGWWASSLQPIGGPDTQILLWQATIPQMPLGLQNNTFVCQQISASSPSAHCVPPFLPTEKRSNTILGLGLPPLLYHKLGKGK